MKTSFYTFYAEGQYVVDKQKFIAPMWKISEQCIEVSAIHYIKIIL
nr:hypothetical protein [Brevibacillus laterosporus]